MNVSKIANRVIPLKMPQYTEAVVTSGGYFELYKGERLIERYTKPKGRGVLSELKEILMSMKTKDKYLFCDILHPYDSTPEAAARYAYVPNSFKALTSFYSKSCYKINNDGTFTVQKWMKGNHPDSSICVTRTGSSQNGKKVFSKDYEVVEFFPKGEIATRYTDGGSTKTVTEIRTGNNRSTETTTIYKKSQTTGNWEEVK